MQLLAFHPLHRPEKHAVLVLELDDCHRGVLAERNARVGIRFGVENLQPLLVTGFHDRIKKDERRAIPVARVRNAPAFHELGVRPPVRRDDGVNALLFHRGHEFENLVEFLLVYVRDFRALLLHRQIAVPARDVHPALCEKPGVMLQVLHLRSALGVIGAAPEPDRLTVPAHESGAVL